MSGFRVGKFNRKLVAGFLRPFCPVQSVDSILDVNPELLVAEGKKLLLVDVDNTLLEWRSEKIPETTGTWIESAEKAGLKVCILSNTRNVARLDRLAKQLGIEYLVGKFKPSRTMYRLALKKFAVKPEEAVMVGDQIFTDVLGANRSGIDAIWVRQMAPIDFVGTRISRLGERIIRGSLYSAMTPDDAALKSPLIQPGATPAATEAPVEEPEADLPVGGSAAFELLQIPIVRQFIKFAIVGATSTLVDVGLHWVLMFQAPYGGVLLSQALGSWLIENLSWLFGGAGKPADAAFPVFKVLTSSLAIVNSFIWNRRWTFKIRGKEHRAVQFQKFIVIALIGMALNTLIASSLNSIIPGHEKRSWAVATIIATIVVAFWNFFGQKLWTFRQKHH